MELEVSEWDGTLSSLNIKLNVCSYQPCGHLCLTESSGSHVHCAKKVQRYDECRSTSGIWCKKSNWLINWNNTSHQQPVTKQINTLTPSSSCIFPRLPLQGKIVAQGRLLLQDTFMVSDPEGSLLGRMKERRVFLFEQLVIFSEPLDKKKGFSLPGFLYKNSIKVTDVKVWQGCALSLSVKASRIWDEWVVVI